jgi:hypothetical protein
MADAKYGIAWLPQGARAGWLDGQDLFLDVDSAYRVAQAMAANGDGIVVGVQTLVKRLHEGGWLKSVDERRGKLKVRRSLSGSRLEVLHLPACRNSCAADRLPAGMPKPCRARLKRSPTPSSPIVTSP